MFALRTAQKRAGWLRTILITALVGMSTWFPSVSFAQEDDEGQSLVEHIQDAVKKVVEESTSSGEGEASGLLEFLREAAERAVAGSTSSAAEHRDSSGSGPSEGDETGGEQPEAAEAVGAKKR